MSIRKLLNTILFGKNDDTEDENSVPQQETKADSDKPNQPEGQVNGNIPETETEKETAGNKRVRNPSALGEFISVDEMPRIEDFLEIRMKKKAETAQPEPDKDEADDTDKKTEDATPGLYNLIILDESGSMSQVTRQTITGCNDTLKGIRKAAEENPELRQYVSIFCFEDFRSRFLFKNMPIEETSEININDYFASGSTPLYDAIGYTVGGLINEIGDTDSVGKVTIITDGEENSSEIWTQTDVLQLIRLLRAKGWLFTFIGANIDVRRRSRSLGISSYMEFEQTDLGMTEMFKTERRSQRAYSDRLGYLRGRRFFTEMDDDRRATTMAEFNENYFIEGERVAPDMITGLAENEIFVFGSNIHGVHDGGAAGMAYSRFGAKQGQAEGLQGRSYAIPTCGATAKEIQEAVVRFTDFVATHPKLKFMMTAVGCGNAGYSPAQIAPLFRKAYSFGNVYVPASFLRYVAVSDDFTS